MTYEVNEQEYYAGFTAGVTHAMSQPLPDDIRECCEVLRDEATWLLAAAQAWASKHYGGLLDGTIPPVQAPSREEVDAAIWQVLEHLGVL